MDIMVLTTIKIEQETKDRLKVRAAQKKMTYTKLIEYLLKLDKKKNSTTHA